MTDLFSAGHIRTPRRKLHSTGPFTVLAGFLGLWPGDQCAGYQHNEDSANGLWVTNALGQSWAAYGDTQLFEGRSAANRRYVVEASQMGVDEIWQAFQLRQAPDSADFAALKKVFPAALCTPIILYRCSYISRSPSLRLQLVLAILCLFSSGIRQTRSLFSSGRSLTIAPVLKAERELTLKLRTPIGEPYGRKLRMEAL